MHNFICVQSFLAFIDNRERMSSALHGSKHSPAVYVLRTRLNRASKRRLHVSAKLAPRSASCVLFVRTALGRALSSCAGRLRAAVSSSAESNASREGDAGEAELWVIVGLGNPGRQYEQTRHNVGFLAVDALAAAEGIDVRSVQCKALVGRGLVAGKKALLVKPQTFMNASGAAVAPLLKFYRVPPSRCLVIYDDLDLETAALRLRKKGGHGGQNGMRSIIAALGDSQEFPRLRIGIGRPKGQREVADHVLSSFEGEEMYKVDICLQQVVDVVRRVLTLGIEKALSTAPNKAQG